MRPEEKIHREIWSALDEITQEKLATPTDEWVLIGNLTKERKRAIRALTKCGAVRIVNTRYRPGHTLRILQEIQGIEEEPVGYYIDTIEPRFTEATDFYFVNVGKPNGPLADHSVAEVTAKLRGWQGSMPVQLTPPTPTKAQVILPEKKIEKLTIIQKSERARTFKVIVNDDYTKPMPFDITKNTGGLLLKLAEKGDPISYSDHKPSFDYLNSADSQLITKSGCARTKILVSEAGYITPIVEIETITEKQFTQRSGKASKKA